MGAICCRLEKPAVPAGGATPGADGTRLYIMTIGVLAPYRSCGVGTELLETTLKDAEKDANISEAYLHVQVRAMLPDMLPYKPLVSVSIPDRPCRNPR